MPSIPQTPPETKPIQPEAKTEERTGQGGGGYDLHPFILGLLQSLPQGGKTASLGVKWPEAKRKVWLQTAENIFTMMYADDGTD